MNARPIVGHLMTCNILDCYGLKERLINYKTPLSYECWAHLVVLWRPVLCIFYTIGGDARNAGGERTARWVEYFLKNGVLFDTVLKQIFGSPGRPFTSSTVRCAVIIMIGDGRNDVVMNWPVNINLYKNYNRRGKERRTREHRSSTNTQSI